MTRRWPVRSANRPTRRETGAPISRRRQPPPTHCGASRRNGRDLIIAKTVQRTRSYSRTASAAAAQAHYLSPTGIVSRPGASAFFVSDGDSFAPRRERFLCLRRPHFFQQRKKWGKERRQKLRFCTSSARYACSPLSVFPHATGVFLIVVGPPTVPAQLSAAAARYYGKKHSFCRVAGYYILCPTGTPTFAAARRQRRDLIIATRPAHQPLPSLLSAAAAQAVQAIPEPTTTPAEPIPRSQHRQICTCPPRAKGSLNRRFEWFSLVTFFLQQKKVTRAGARNSPPPAAKY